jgi:hypothetical protein
MKTSVIIVLIFFGTLQACNEGATAVLDANCLAVIYITGICGEAVLKIENPTMFHLGESWNGHNNVFFTQLPCGTDEQTLLDKTFFVEIIPETQTDNDCVRCKATIGYNGTKRYNIALRHNCQLIPE